MKTAIGILMVIGGIVCGLYAGVWWAFIGGIVDVITEIRAVDMSASNLALGVAKIVFAGAIGWLAAIVLLIPGVSLIND